MFMRDYQDMVFATARRLTVSDVTAQDITQDVFVKAWEHFDGLRAASGAGGWLKTVTLRLSLNHLSRYRRRWRFFSELLPVNAADDDASDTEVEFAVSGLDTVFTQLADAQRDARVRTALARLPDAQRIPLVLFHYEERSYQQIAADLEVSVAKVKTDILRGRLALAKQLQESAHES